LQLSRAKYFFQHVRIGRACSASSSVPDNVMTSAGVMMTVAMSVDMVEPQQNQPTASVRGALAAGLADAATATPLSVSMMVKTFWTAVGRQSV
jgi:hypothetical protein